MIKKKKMNLEEPVFLGILCAEGIILGVIESSLPPILAFAPGAKIGLTNIISLIALLILPFKDVMLLTFLRITLAALISGTVSSFFYAFSGAYVSLFSMKLLCFLYPKVFSLYGISMVGGIMHNLGQLLIASLIAKNWYIMLYLPVLTIMGIFAGILVGVSAQYLLKYINAMSFIKRKLFITER